MLCWHALSVPQPCKLKTRVRFPSPAPLLLPTRRLRLPRGAQWSLTRRALSALGWRKHLNFGLKFVGDIYNVGRACCPSKRPSRIALVWTTARNPPTRLWRSGGAQPALLSPLVAWRSSKTGAPKNPLIDWCRYGRAKRGLAPLRRAACVALERIQGLHDFAGRY